MDVVCDTSTLIKLRTGCVFGCLGQLFQKIYIPLGVYAECQDSLTQEAIRQAPFIEIRSVAQILSLTGIGKGELEAISLCVEMGIVTFITDDEKAFRKAIQQNLLVIRSYQLLLLAKQAHYIPSIKNVLDEMRAQGEGITEDLYQNILRQAGE